MRNLICRQRVRDHVRCWASKGFSFRGFKHWVVEWGSRFLMSNLEQPQVMLVQATTKATRWSALGQLLSAVTVSFLLPVWFRRSLARWSVDKIRTSIAERHRWVSYTQIVWLFDRLGRKQDRNSCEGLIMLKFMGISKWYSQSFCLSA